MATKTKWTQEIEIQGTVRTIHLEKTTKKHCKCCGWEGEIEPSKGYCPMVISDVDWNTEEKCGQVLTRGPKRR